MTDKDWLRNVVWEAVPPPENADSTQPHVTHAGEIRFAGWRLRCHQLSDGRRVFDTEDIERFVNAAEDEHAG